MTVKQLTEKLNLKVLSEGGSGDVIVRGCFASDLLSLAMSCINAYDVWITVQTNVNILGVSALTEAACVIVANGMNVSAEVIQKAKDEDICLLHSEKSIYELCCLIGDSI